MTRDEIKRVIGYVRVSTTEQELSGNGLEAQREAIERACVYRRWELAGVYQDVTSGKSTNGRHGLEAALAELAAGRADALVAAKLDRLSRSVGDFAGLLETSRKQGWALVCLDVDMDTSTVMGEAMAGMASVFAQMERRRIGERTKEAMAVIKARGPKEGKQAIGRPKKIGLALEARIARMRRRGWSFQKIADKLTHDGVPTPTGKDAWSFTTVALVCKRLGLEPVRTRARRT